MAETPPSPTAGPASEPGAIRLPDPGRAQRMAANPRISVWVGASAGSGKTKVLTDRILNLLLDGCPPNRLLCLTYTKAAAAEMLVRLSNRLSAWTVMPEGPEDRKDTLRFELADLRGRTPTVEEVDEARRLFARVLDAPGGLTIKTIHAFCQSLLARFPIEAGVPPHFDLADDQTAGELMTEARTRVLERARAETDPALAAALATVSDTLTGLGFEEIMNTVVLRDRARLADALRRTGGLAALNAALDRTVGVEPEETVDTVIVGAVADGVFPAEDLRAAMTALLAGSKTDIGRGEAMAAWLSLPDAAARSRDWPVWRGCFLTSEGERRARLATKTALKAAPDALDILEREAERVLAVEERCRAVALARRTAALITLSTAILEDYEAVKAARALLDFDDLIQRAADLLTREGMAEWVLFKLDEGLDHILIDEAQDTAPRQWRVVRALADEFFTGDSAHEARVQNDPEAGPRTVFAVGDTKQSIYSFQGAEPQGFLDTRAYVAGKAADAGRAFESVPMALSFRSTGTVLRSVDAVFNREPARTGVVEPGLSRVDHESFRVGHAGRVELWPMVEGEESEAPEPWAPPVARGTSDDPAARLAARIAGQVAGWIGRETMPARDRTVRAGDIMILVRRRDALVTELARALKRQGIAVAGVDRLVLLNDMAVRDLMTLGRAALLPEDDLTLATALKGPLIGMDDQALEDLASGRARPRLWHALRDRAESDPALAAIRDRLSALRDQARALPPHDFYQQVLTQGGRRALTRRLGLEADEAIDEFLNQALAYEASHTPSLQGFLRWIEVAEVVVKREMEAGSADQVRIMTVHGSKGLQAPIVILPDTARPPQNRESLLWSEPEGEAPALPLWSSGAKRDEAVAARARAALNDRAAREYRRLLYVAMTRAEDRLIVCGWTNKRKAAEDGWYNLVRGALLEIGQPFTPFDGSEADAENPGLLLEDPQQVPPKADGGPDGGQTPAAAPPPDWVTSPAPREPTPPQPLAPVRDEAAEEPAVRSPLAADDRFKRGTVLHRLLQSLPDVPPAERAAVGRRYLTRATHRIPADLAEAWLAEALAVLDDSRFAEVFASGSRAEAPIVGLLGGRVISRRIDRIRVTEDTVLIVDFKTNRPPPTDIDAIPEIYLRQIAEYRLLLTGLYPKHAVRCGLLWTDAPALMEVPQTLTDRFASPS